MFTNCNFSCAQQQPNHNTNTHTHLYGCALQVFFMTGYVTLHDDTCQMKIHDDKAFVTLQVIAQHYIDILSSAVRPMFTHAHAHAHAHAHTYM